MLKLQYSGRQKWVGYGMPSLECTLKRGKLAVLPTSCFANIQALKHYSQMRLASHLSLKKIMPFSIFKLSLRLGSRY